MIVRMCGKVIRDTSLVGASIYPPFSRTQSFMEFFEWLTGGEGDKNLIMEFVREMGREIGSQIGESISNFGTFIMESIRLGILDVTYLGSIVFLIYYCFRLMFGKSNEKTFRGIYFSIMAFLIANALWGI